jgi:curli production assembly/transport component CsgF
VQQRAATPQLTPAELFARQLESRLLAALSSGLIQAITGAAPGTTGEFVLGDQRIVFERTLTEIKVTIFNDVTGEVTEITVPVLNFAGPTTPSPGPGTTSSASVEAILAGAMPGTSTSLDSPASLDGEPLEPPPGGSDR